MSGSPSRKLWTAYWPVDGTSRSIDYLVDYCSRIGKVANFELHKLGTDGYGFVTFYRLSDARRCYEGLRAADRKVDWFRNSSRRFSVVDDDAVLAQLASPTEPAPSCEAIQQTCVNLFGGPMLTVQKHASIPRAFLLRWDDVRHARTARSCGSVLVQGMKEEMLLSAPPEAEPAPAPKPRERSRERSRERTRRARSKSRSPRARSRSPRARSKRVRERSVTPPRPIDPQVAQLMAQNFLLMSALQQQVNSAAPAAAPQLDLGAAFLQLLSQKQRK